ncbi:MAG: ATP-binding protein [Streptosporangiaceae bacterium]
MLEYLPRLVDPLLGELLTDHPAVLVVGPRACGKTTTGRRHCQDRLRLDRPAEAAVVRADPDAALAEDRFPLLVDEWQVVPEVLGAVKRAVDEGAAPGSFVLTGSSQADLTAAGWPATGRLIRVLMYGLVERELERGSSQPPVLDRLLSEGADGLSVPPDPPDIRGYVARALRGGFPEAALASSERASRRWLSSYIDQLVSRDVSLVGAVRDPMRIRHYLQAVAASTAGMPTLKTLIDAVGIDRSTANAYDSLLERLLITQRLPAWSSNRLNRLIRLPKRYLVDPAFLSPLLGVDARAVLRDGDLLGRLLDSFVMAQLRAECAVSELSPHLFHVRDANGRQEVDILIEFGDGRMIGIEVKADAAPGPDAATHLRWLRDGIGNRFALGLVLHTGPRPFRLDESIVALPICALWG